MDKSQILGIKRASNWTLLRVGIRETELKQLVLLVQGNLLTERSIPYYAHFYREGELVVVFPERIFHLKLDKSTWQPVVSYGKSMGIPQEELDFRPCRFEDETF